ncbi:MAG: nickel/cobalt transporter, partial [Blastocatellia bacterium]
MLSFITPGLAWRRRVSILTLTTLMIVSIFQALAHPLGNFTINHFIHVETGADHAKIRYVVDLAEVPSFQESQKADTDQNGALSEAELTAYLDSIAQGYVSGLKLSADGKPVDLKLMEKHIGLSPGVAGLMTLRMVFDLTGDWIANANSRLRLENTNLTERAGWREIVVTPINGVSVFNSTAFGNSATDELKAYPEDLLLAPLNESKAEWSATLGALPVEAKPLTMRNGKPVAIQRDRFAELITVRELTPMIIFIGLLLAFVWGGAHALTPGHGKTVVGAYLVGSRGTPKHAIYLGLATTITHTVTVYGVWLAMYLFSRTVAPEKFFPVMQFVSGALILVIGASSLVSRLRSAMGLHSHSDLHHEHDHGHSHLPPGTDGKDDSPITWRSLLAMGVSGGIMPCPSAYLLLFGAAAVNRIGYALVLIVFFSLGLASVLTAVGLAFVYGGKLFGKISRANKLMKVIPVLSALVITVLGAVICYQALQQTGINPADLWHGKLEEAKSVSAMAILGLGLVIGLRHALDTDHLAAVSTIVSEQKNLFSSLLIGGLWGIGHTVSLLIAGVAVIFLNLKIGKYEKQLEFCVALMLIGLGLNVLVKLARGGKIHFHEHKHGGLQHVHPHLHDGKPEPGPHTHHGLQLSLRPLVIGLVHGLAGSAALMLGVLSTIKSTPLAFGYIIIFGIGSIGGMMVMSLILSLPLHLTAVSFT